jgi:hypothetical protein
MNLKYFLCISVMAMCIAATAEATTKGKKKSKADFRLIEAYSQRTIPGIPGATPKTAYHFIIVWENKNYPETFFWRGDNGWVTCNIVKAHKVKAKSKNVPKGMDYTIENVSGDAIHKGDTVQLTPTPGGKFPVPAEIPADAKNTLYYKTGGSGWLSFPVKNISKKPDVTLQ